MVQRVASPQQFRTLLELLLVAQPRVRLLVLKILGNYTRTGVSSDALEEAVALAAGVPESNAFRLLRRVVT